MARARRWCPEFIERWDATRGSPNQLRELASVAGAYLPDFYIPVYDDAGRLATVNYSGPGSAQVNRRLIRDLNRFTTSSLILTEESVFGDMFLVEASRGCQWGCRFCAAGFMYRPIRYRAPEVLIAEAERGLGERKVIGLVGAEMASVPGVADIASAVVDRGGRLSPSSLKADCISPALASALARGGNQSVTVAPEAGSERMRKVINKNLSEAEILHAAEMMLGEGVGNLKFYFMIGLPEERDEDVLAIADLVGQSARTRPCPPHPHRPCDDIAESVCAQAVDAVSMGSDAGRALDQAQSRDVARSALRGSGRSSSTPSRRARRISRPWSPAAIAASARILERLEAAGCESCRSQSGTSCEDPSRGRGGRDSDRCPIPIFSSRATILHDELLPWDFIDHHIYKWFLLAERKKAHHEHQSPPCDVERCTVCGAC